MSANSLIDRQQANTFERKCNSESGFTLLEMCVAMLILLVGLLAVASSVGYALMVSNKGRNVTNTKLLVVAMLEQMETLRNAKQLTYGQISNVGNVDNTNATRVFNGFPAGYQPVTKTNNPGPDGIIGTDDDLVAAGVDGTFGTADDYVDQSLSRPGYTREIVITPISSNMKRIQVTLRYPGPGGDYLTRVGVSYLNDDARGVFIP